MSTRIYPYLELLILIGVSFFGLFFAVILAFSPTATLNFVYRKPMIGSIFGMVCILGILAVFSPRKCSNIFYCQKEDSIDSSKRGYLNANKKSFVFDLKIVHKHHPSCENFSSHEFQIGKKSYCVGCTGLLFGALISLFGTIIYFSNSWQIIQESLFFIGIGISGVSSGLLAPFFNLRRKTLRFSLNVIFIFGMFSILIWGDTLAQSLFIDLFLISLSVFWLFTRISLSQWNHQRICNACGIQCELSRNNKDSKRFTFIYKI